MVRLGDGEGALAREGEGEVGEEGGGGVAGRGGSVMGEVTGGAGAAWTAVLGLLMDSWRR